MVMGREHQRETSRMTTRITTRVGVDLRYCVASVVVEVFGDEGPGVVSFTLYGGSRALPVLS